MEINEEEIQIHEKIKKLFNEQEIISLLCTAQGMSYLLMSYICAVFKSQEHLISESVQYCISVTLANTHAVINSNAGESIFDMTVLTNEKDEHKKYLYVIETFYKDLVKRGLLKNETN